MKPDSAQNTRGRRVNLLANPVRLLRERDAARTALADVLRATYDDDLPDHLADKFRRIVERGVNIDAE